MGRLDILGFFDCCGWNILPSRCRKQRHEGIPVAWRRRPARCAADRLHEGPGLLFMRTRPFRPEGQYLLWTIADNIGALMKDDPGARRHCDRIPRRPDTKTVQLSLA